ncbi:putative ribonuclease H-like domain-containing protein [Tanacetum coccineum]
MILGQLEMEHYLEYIDNEVWKVIQNGNSKKRISTGKDGVIQVLSPVTAAEIQAVEKGGLAKKDILVFEQEIQGAPKPSSSAQNVAFVSQSKSSTNKVKSGFSGAYSSCTPSTSSTNVPEKEVLAGFIDDVDIEEMDINWQIAMIAIRMKKECTAKGTHDGKKKRDSLYQHQEAGKQEKNQRFAEMDVVIVQLGRNIEAEETNHALMAISDQEAQILAYSQAVKKLEAQLVTSQKQQLSLNEKLAFQANEIHEKDEKLKRFIENRNESCKRKGTIARKQRPFAKSTAQMAHTNAVMGNWGSAVKTSARTSTDETLVDRGIFDSGCSGHYDKHIFLDEASYDEEGVITDFNSLPTEIEVSPTPTLRDSIIFTKKSNTCKEQSQRSTALFVYDGFYLKRNLKRLMNFYNDVSWFSHAEETVTVQATTSMGSCRSTSWNEGDWHQTEEVYVSQPPGFVDPDHPTKVYKVVKALYGLHQAPRAWYATLSTFLEKHGYKRGTIDKTLFIRRNKKDIMLVQVYVDDIIFGSTNKSWCDEFEALMQSRFQMSSMGELTFFLGLQVKQNKGGIFISQDKSMIGSLMYLTASRPDIMYAVCVCSRFQVTPKTSHLNAVKRIFKYLKGKPHLGLWYPRESPFDLEAFSDSDYGGSNLDRKSTTGGCQFLGQRLISWQCKKQTIMATSTTEAEYVAAANCCGQVLWVQNQLLDYGFNFMNTKIHIDNESTICIVKNPVYHSKTKHIEIRHHFIRDCYEKKLISIAWMKGRSAKFWQTAIANTKADGSLEINATIDTIRYTIFEASIRDSLQLEDATGITMLPNDELFEGMGQIGSKSGGWDQFGSNIATALICLSTGRVYNFSKLIFDGMVANLKSKTKFLMYPRFLQMILNIQTEDKHLYLAVSLTKKIFGNMKRGFRGAPRPLLPSMLLVATNPNAGQEHAAVAQSQPSSSTPQVQSHTPTPTPPPIHTPTPTPPPIHTPTPTPIPKTEPEPFEHIFEEPSPVHKHFSPPHKSKARKQVEVRRGKVKELGCRGSGSRVPFETVQGDFSFATPEKEQGFRGGSRRTYKSSSTLELKFNMLKLYTAELNPVSSPSAQVNNVEVSCCESCMRDNKMLAYDFCWLIGSEEDERAIKKMNEKDADKEEEKKDESVHEEVQEEEGAKKRKLGTRRKEDLKVIYELVMEEYKDRLPEGFDRMLWGDLMIMFNQGDTAVFWDTQQDWKLISWKLHSSSGLETEEESSMALELIKFVKQQLEEFEDSNDDDTVTSTHEDAERV